MKLNDLHEGIGDSLKAADSAVMGLAGKAGQAIGSFAPTAGVLGSAFARAIGFDGSQPEVGGVQRGIAKKQFVGTFVQKISGFISATQESVKDDITAIIKQEQQQAQQAQAQQAQAQQAGMQRESNEYNLLFKIALKESQQTDQFINRYAGVIENSIKTYLGNQIGSLGPQVSNASKQIAQLVVQEKNYLGILEDLGSAVFDQFYSTKRNEFTQSHPAADTPLSSDGEQVLAALKRLSKQEQQIVIQKLEKGGNLF
jgi:hypothetical protein